MKTFTSKNVQVSIDDNGTVRVTMPGGAVVRVHDQAHGLPRVYVEVPTVEPFASLGGQTLCTVIVKGKEGADARCHLSLKKSSYGPSAKSLRAVLNVAKRGSDVQKDAVMTYWK